MWVCGAGGRLPDQLNKKRRIERSNQSLGVATWCAQVLLCAHIVERHINGMPDAKLIFAKQSGEIECSGRWKKGGDRWSSGRRYGGQRRSDGLLSLYRGVGIGSGESTSCYNKYNEERKMTHVPDYTVFRNNIIGIGVIQLEGARMRKFLISTILLILILAACSPMQTTSEAESPADEIPATIPPVATDTEQPLDPIEENVVKRLAKNIGLDESDVSVISNKTVEFTDACLGITMPGVKCAQVTMLGQIITLEADNIQYEYRTDRSGKRIQPATLALTWKREGGIAGFCDNLMVFRSGEVYAYKCDAQADARVDSFDNLLSSKELIQFNTWFTEFNQITLDVSDPKGVSDRMEVVLELHGVGKEKPSEEEQQDLIAWAQDLFQELYS